MNPVFEIIPEALVPEKTNLVGEITEKSFTYFFQRDEDKMIVGLSAFHFKQDNTQELVQDLQKTFSQQPLLNKNFNKVCISYSMPQSILFPAGFYRSAQNDALLDAMHGDINSGTVFTDKIAEKNIYNVYRISSILHHAVTAKFPLAHFTHQYSILIKNLPPAGNVLQVIFYQEKFVVALVKDGKLQIIQTYNYKAAKDISYHLLNVCTQFEVTDVSVELSGMIDEDSALFREIHKYFLNVTFRSWNDEFGYAEVIKKFPSHFFAHQFSIASCV